jgi:RHS repeat-associated protein
MVLTSSGIALDEVFTRTDALGTMTYLTDAMRSTLALTDVSGAVQTQYAYELFGNLQLSGATTANALTFTGREADGTGLYYYRSRYYSPRFQRFISSDPIGFAGGDLDTLQLRWQFAGCVFGSAWA